MEVEGDAKWPENEISQTFPKGAWDTGDLSYARPLRLDSPSLFWDGKQLQKPELSRTEGGDCGVAPLSPPGADEGRLAITRP